MNTVAERPRVWVVYRDTRKDMSPAEKFGQLTDMFTGRVNYERAVYQARKMLQNYKDGDYLMMVGDPTLCLIVGAVALEYSENDTLKLLRWDRDDIEYRPMEQFFGEGAAEAAPAPADAAGAVVVRRNRWGA